MMEATTRKIGDVATKITKGTTPTTLGLGYAEAGIPFLRAQNLVDGQVSVEADPLYISEKTHAHLSRSQIKANDVLVSIAGTIGRAAYVSDHFDDLNCNQAVAIIRPGGSIYPRYLLHWLNSGAALTQITKAKVTATISNLSLSQIADLEIPLPSISEQERIAAILDQADALRRARRRALDRLSHLGQSIFHKMFGGEEFYPQPIKLGELVSEFRYGTSTKATSQGHPVLRIPNVVGGEIDLSDLKTVSLSKTEFERLSLSPGDLLFVRTNGNRSYVGRSAVVPERFDGDVTSPKEYVFASYLIRARLISEMNPIFVQAFLDFGTGRRQLLEHTKTSAGQYNINIQGLSDIGIPNVPRSAQDKYASQVSSIKEIGKTHQQDLSQLGELYASLQQRAFRGEL